MFDCWEGPGSLDLGPLSVLLDGVLDLEPDGGAMLGVYSAGAGAVLVMGPAADEEAGDRVPAEGEDGEGVDQPGGAVGQGVQGAEGQSHAPLPGGQGVAHIDGGDGLHEEAHHQVGKADVSEEKISGALLEAVLTSDRAHDH